MRRLREGLEDITGGAPALSLTRWERLEGLRTAVGPLAPHRAGVRRRPRQPAETGSDTRALIRPFQVTSPAGARSGNRLSIRSKGDARLQTGRGRAEAVVRAGPNARWVLGPFAVQAQRVRVLAQRAASRFAEAARRPPSRPAGSPRR